MWRFGSASSWRRRGQAHGGQRVWIFTHQAVIMSFRFVLERLDEH